MAKPYDAVVAGHICVDVFPDLSAIPEGQWEALFQPGRLVKTGPLSFSTGGAVSNTGLALHKLGIRTRLVGKIGADLLGQIVRRVVEAHRGHLADGMVVDGAVDTSYTVIVNPPGVDRIFLHCPSANDAFVAADVDYDVVAQARLFHFGYPSLMRRMFEDDGAQSVALLRRVKEAGVTTSLDMSFPDPTSPAGRADWMAICRAVMPYVDVFLPNVEETLYMLRRGTYEDLSQAAGGDLLSQVTPALLSDLSGEVLAMGAGIVGLKLGHRGLYVHTAGRLAMEALGAARPGDPASWADRELWAPCFRADVAGTTGAGDATVAGFLCALLRGTSLEEAVTMAVAVGACNVEAADALSGIRSWEETRRRVEDGWARHELSLDAPGWRFDDCHQMWMGSAEV
jgi:sugar/nucleoside kinase (ribokinase family)